MAKKKAIKKRLYNLTHFLQATHFHPEVEPLPPLPETLPLTLKTLPKGLPLGTSTEGIRSSALRARPKHTVPARGGEYLRCLATGTILILGGNT